VGLADEFEGLAGGGGKRVFDEAVLQADAEIAEEELDEKFRFDGREGSETGLEEIEFFRGRAGGCESGEEFTEAEERETRCGKRARERRLRLRIRKLVT